MLCKEMRRLLMPCTVYTWKPSTGMSTADASPYKLGMHPDITSNLRTGKSHSVSPLTSSIAP